MVRFLRTAVKQQACRIYNYLIKNLKQGNLPLNRQLFPDLNREGWETLTPGVGSQEIAAVAPIPLGQPIA